MIVTVQTIQTMIPAPPKQKDGDNELFIMFLLDSPMLHPPPREDHFLALALSSWLPKPFTFIGFLYWIHSRLYVYLSIQSMAADGSGRSGGDTQWHIG